MAEILPRDQYLYMAKIAQQANRYKDVIHYMKKLVSAYVSPVSPLTTEERNLFLLAYENVMNSLRSGWRTVSSFEKVGQESSKNSVKIILEYRTKLESEISEVCAEILKVLDDIFIPSLSCNEPEWEVFFLTIKGDYWRYLAEHKVDDDLRKAAMEAMLTYKRAEELALVKLNHAHPMRLAVALNLAVLYFDILNESEKACSTAGNAYRNALSDLNFLNSLPEEQYKGSTLILQRLKENLTRWDVQNTLVD